ncbi:GTP cyclohydrolase II [Mycobacteroides abscessus]|uniref:GTP cyclohydrolase II n=1 Tax=Mycobacteroides abscessus TaxID=36809 RepID=UPI0005E49122|nr:GTP cyclohydrolase II [Mycobacteroides abscessus]CPS43720.1 bifunctional 3%2C4-dihydroxy-2-butanone 4-phosphate synthase/GTP cyclohydrolase II protein [Mycobacteroides abscessus]CPS45546.1 bifunctional 3%2C4-dihydroxy-2-butanone 4-phosphate synthase/GTP cyclohydrolase II protein [Mycobacteroides abscessus]CPS54600.1 bifunctional 3%2C4-dihydroxy-2-butanone 4-phosphate synthase/GTP cyclohydrolase II protein [Mycobacteroides abscessus]CPT37355.1 bifunctional 3%2C4-dihydroxy-2-butanone 4-phospha
MTSMAGTPKVKRSAAVVQPPSVVILSEAAVETVVGGFAAIQFSVMGDTATHIALVRGDVSGDSVLTRVHSECLTGDVFGSRRCDCGQQLIAAMSAVAKAGRGVVVYLRGHEGCGIGLVNKFRAYALQERGLDTIEANLALGLPVDARSYEGAAGILKYLKVRSVALLTNNPEKVKSLARSGIRCSAVIPMSAFLFEDNRRYLTVKAEKMGHRGLLSLSGFRRG